MAREGWELAGRGREEGRKGKHGKKWLFAVRVALKRFHVRNGGAFFEFCLDLYDEVSYKLKLGERAGVLEYADCCAACCWMRFVF